MTDTKRAMSLSVAASAITSIVLLGASMLATNQRPNLSARDVSTPIGGLPALIDGSAGTVPETVQRTEPAVVSVLITKDVPIMEQYFEGQDDFFSPFGFQFPRYRQNGTEQREVGGGSAFFVSADGLLMTNKHVVDDEEASYTVFLNDGKKLSAKVVATDPTNDIALLQVEGRNYPYLEISDEDPILGQTVIAIGNALGEFRNTVSVGVVSGLSRSIVAGGARGGVSEQLSRIIQTDAAVNQGNSGGPLLDLTGRVIGMNTAVASSAQNIAFALPSGDLTRVLQSYTQYGRIVRPYIGIRYTMINKALQEENKLDYDYGALIAKGDTPTDLAVIPGSPADKAGLEENDIILAADGEKLTEENPVMTIIQRKMPGDTLKLNISHDGSEKEVTVTLEEWKDE